MEGFSLKLWRYRDLGILTTHFWKHYLLLRSLWTDKNKKEANIGRGF